MYQGLFAASQGSHAAAPVQEMSFADMRAANEALLGQLELLDSSINNTQAACDKLEAFMEMGAHFGAPKTQLETSLTAFALLSTFNGEATVSEITDGYGMESLSDDADFGYSLESLKERAKSLYTWIRDQVMRIYEIIETFFYNLLGAVPSIRKKAAALTERANAASGLTPTESKFDINAQTAGVLANHKNEVFSKAQPIIDVIQSTITALEVADGKYYSKLEKLGVEMEKFISGVDLEKDVALNTLNTEFDGADAVKHLRDSKPFGLVAKTVSKDKRFQGRKVRSVAMASGKTLFIHEREVDGTDSGAVAKGEANLSLSAELRDTDDKMKKIEKGTMDTWTTADCENFADALEKVCDLIEAITRGAAKGDIKKIKEKIDTAAKKLDKAVDAAKKKTGEDKLSADKLTECRVTLKYTKTYAGLVARPIPQMIALVTSLANSGLSVANKSLSLHK